MRVGFVRNVGLAALGLAVVALAACNDDPLSFDNDATTGLFVNPSVMVVPAGRVSKLESRATNQGAEPTFAEVLVNDTQLAEGETVNAGCVTVGLDPDATNLTPPGLFVVTGLNGLGSCSFTLSAGGVSETVDVTVVADAIEFVNPPAALNFESTVQLEARLISFDGETVTPFSATDATWSTDDPAVATVDETGLVTGVGAGTATIEVCWSGTAATGTADLGVERCAETAIEVVVGTPDLTSLSPSSGGFQDVVTINGTGFVSVHQLYLDGFDYSYLIESQTPTAITFQWPNLGNGDHTVEVGIPGSPSNSLTFTQSSDAEAHEPANDDPGTTTSTLTASGVYVGGFGTGEFDDWIEVTIPEDGTYDFVLYWNTGQDLDLILFDDTLTDFCFSFYSNPEADCVGQELTAGTYYALVEDFSASIGDVQTSSYALRVDAVEEE